MGEWKAYQVWSVSMGDSVYMVGRKIDDGRPLSERNIEWNGFYSKDADTAVSFARELNRKEKS